MFVVRVDESQTGISRDDLIDEMREMNIGTSVHYVPTHLFSAYRDARHGDLSVTDRVWLSLLSLPLYPSMSDAELLDVVEALATIVDRTRSRLAVRPAV
jgi:dTDP-4-amino-4,6-dideoxygalactose transaminase